MKQIEAFDCPPHDLLIAKLAAYGFGTKTLHLFHSHLYGRKHRVRISTSFSDSYLIKGFHKDLCLDLSYLTSSLMTYYLPMITPYMFEAQIFLTSCVK